MLCALKSRRREAERYQPAFYFSTFRLTNPLCKKFLQHKQKNGRKSRSLRLIVQHWILKSMSTQIQSIENEPELIEACKRGDHRAFEQIYVKYKERIYTLCTYMSGDRETARVPLTWIKESCVARGFSPCLTASPNEHKCLTKQIQPTRFSCEISGFVEIRDFVNLQSFASRALLICDVITPPPFCYYSLAIFLYKFLQHK